MSRVISAFPATGKTFVAGRDHRFVDSDSSRFSWGTPGVRNPNWPSNYIAHIEGELASGRKVLVSTHAEVRDALRDAGIPFTLAYPSEDQAEAYVRRMRERGSDEAMVDFISTLWDSLIASCRAQEGCEHVVLGSGQYLADVLGRETALFAPLERPEEGR